ncbi:MAG TPA: chondroitinase-B domain-containing protein, partial [Lacipirellulaceae bacterium]|nr:chondroitinase-B domain-containing protein [Lacipirellulaceae bacterium]
VMADGVWTNQRIQFAAHGTAENPITLRAQTPGQVVLTGNSKVNISGSHLVVDGLRFEGGALAANDHVVEFRGSLGQATHSRLTNSTIVNYNPANINTRYFWVSLYGQHNRVDHNRFEGQSHSGIAVVMWRRTSAADHHLIDSNHFLNRPPGNDNGFETIRIGDSNQSLSNSYTTVQNNLFERIDGEIEMISNKSGFNTFRYNTFRESAGTLTLRHGNDNLVEGNFFLGAGKSQSGGVRVIGERQTVINNYIADVDDRAGGAISISAGVPNSALNQYYQVQDAVIAHNTVLHVDGPAMTFDDGLGSSGRSLLAARVTVANNLFRSSGSPIFEGFQGADWTWEGNLAFGGNLGLVAGHPGVTVADPQIQFWPDGLWRPAATSPAINAAVGDYSSLVPFDMDGQPRIGLFDIGADERSTAAIARRPLVAGDVGPAWLAVPPPAGSSNRFFADGAAIQAENFTYLTDPNGDGDTWTVAASIDALGGQSLRAPAGSVTNIPGQPHDAIAAYDLSFQQPGVYHAYYRARGFDTSSDSMYIPHALGVDPTVNLALSSDGGFGWILSGTFTIDSAHVGMPLEFRLGKRERLAEIDAFVLHLNGSLTAAELDALFAPQLLAGDFNQDGFVDDQDLLAWTAGYGMTQASLADGDANGDRNVDEADLAGIRAELGTLLVGRSVRSGLARIAERDADPIAPTRPRDIAILEILPAVGEGL